MSDVKVERDAVGQVRIEWFGKSIFTGNDAEARELYKKLGEVLRSAPNCIHGRTPDEPCRKCDEP